MRLVTLSKMSAASRRDAGEIQPAGLEIPMLMNMASEKTTRNSGSTMNQHIRRTSAHMSSGLMPKY